MERCRASNFHLYKFALSIKHLTDKPLPLDVYLGIRPPDVEVNIWDVSCVEQVLQGRKLFFNRLFLL